MVQNVKEIGKWHRYTGAAGGEACVDHLLSELEKYGVPAKAERYQAFVSLPIDAVSYTHLEQLFNDPRHPYTKALLSAIPIPDPEKKMERIQLNGELTSPINVGAGCRFAKRCLYAKPECSTQNPQLTEVEPGHFVSCIQCK